MKKWNFLFCKQHLLSWDVVRERRCVCVCVWERERGREIKCQFYQLSIRSSSASRFTLILLTYGIDHRSKKLVVTSSCVYWKSWAYTMVCWVRRCGKQLRHSFLGETERRKIKTADLKLWLQVHLRFSSKGWWNWPKVSISSTFYAKLFAWKCFAQLFSSYSLAL